MSNSRDEVKNKKSGYGSEGRGIKIFQRGSRKNERWSSLSLSKP
jgi:hypothetical protein